MHWITFPTTIFVQALRRLVVDNRTPILVRCGVRAMGAGEEWLVRELAAPGTRTEAQPYERLLQLRVVEAVPTEGRQSGGPAHGHLWLGMGSLEGRLGGGLWRHGQWQPLEGVRLAGRGMYRLVAAPLPGATGNWPVRWSRTIGALGGMDVWQRLTQLRVGVIGCSRSGSLAAEALARLGIQDLTLIDPDQLEPHNLGEMALVTPADVGEMKSVAVARRLRQLLSDGARSPIAVTTGVMEPAALRLASGCDVLFNCVDNDGARLAVGMLATLFNRVLVDIGTGIWFDDSPAALWSPAGDVSLDSRRTMGADVRLLVPAEGCLHCMGGVADRGQAVAELFSRPGDGHDRPWQRERAGSLQALNMMAVAAGIQMVQDLIGQRIGTSTWCQLRVGGNGAMAVSYRRHTAETVGQVCPSCARRGLGDYGL